MAESGFFRVSLRGFNKKDVLKYIDEIQTAHATRLAELDSLRVAAEEALMTERQQVSELTARISSFEQEKAELTDHIEKLNALAQIYKAELVSLRAQQAEYEQAKESSDQLEEALRRNRELEEQVALLKEQNARYAVVVGDVSRLVVEARVVSASYLDAAHKKSEECIQSLDAFLSELKRQVEKVREGADANRRAGDVHIETLLADLQELGDTLPPNEE